MADEKVKISVVVPVWNEAGKVSGDVAALKRYFDEKGVRGEVIVVDDGSSDGTAEVVEMEADGDIVKVIRLGRHAGKGAAVKEGVMRARGEIIGFMDSGGCVDVGYVTMAVEMIEAGECDIVHGSRNLAGAKVYGERGILRRGYSIFFRGVMKMIFKGVRGLSDSQCGFKFYRGDIGKELYAGMVTEGFMFDVEIIERAARRGYRIAEMGMEWQVDRDSRLRPVRELPKIVGEIFRIKFRR